MSLIRRAELMYGVHFEQLALVNAMQSEYILGEINTYGDNIHGLSLSNE